MSDREFNREFSDIFFILSMINSEFLQAKKNWKVLEVPLRGFPVSFNKVELSEINWKFDTIKI